MSKNSTGMNVGGSSILVIFVLLCLTTFATLSMVSANADYKLTKKSQVSIEAYYVADCIAEEKLAQIDAALKLDYSGGYTTESLAAVEGLEIAPWQNGAANIVYLVPINEAQEIFVSLTAYNENIAQDTFYKIDTWQVRTIASAQEETNNMFGEEELNLFAG